MYHHRGWKDVIKLTDGCDLAQGPDGICSDRRLWSRIFCWVLWEGNRCVRIASQFGAILPEVSLRGGPHPSQRRVAASINSMEGYCFAAPGAKNHFDAVSSVFRKFNNWVDTLIRPTGFDGCVPSTSRSWQLHTNPSLRGIIPFAQ
jgi:hypothetical protein